MEASGSHEQGAALLGKSVPTVSSFFWRCWFRGSVSTQLRERSSKRCRVRLGLIEKTCRALSILNSGRETFQLFLWSHFNFHELRERVHGLCCAWPRISQAIETFEKWELSGEVKIRCTSCVSSEQTLEQLKIDSTSSIDDGPNKVCDISVENYPECFSSNY